MATIAGAKALHWDDEISSLASGKKADVFTVPVNDFRSVGVRRGLRDSEARLPIGRAH